jgi:hypothetical protein
MNEKAMQRVARGLIDTANRPVERKPNRGPLGGLVPPPEVAVKAAANLNMSERMSLAKQGVAMPDGSFPIRNRVDLGKAMIRAHQSGKPAAAKAHIKKRAKALNLGHMLPAGY